MTAFDLFQQATVQIQYGQKFNAASSLTAAIAQIDRDGVDAYMRAALDRFEAIAALKVRWETICSSMNEGTWPGSEADALAEIERIKGEIAAIGSTSELIGGAV